MVVLHRSGKESGAGGVLFPGGDGAFEEGEELERFDERFPLRPVFVTEFGAEPCPAGAIVAFKCGHFFDGEERVAQEACGEGVIVWTAEDVARYIGCSIRQIRNFRYAGMPTIKFRNLIRFDPEVVRGWLREQAG